MCWFSNSLFSKKVGQVGHFASFLIDLQSSHWLFLLYILKVLLGNLLACSFSHLFTTISFRPVCSINVKLLWILHWSFINVGRDSGFIIDGFLIHVTVAHLPCKTLKFDDRSDTFAGLYTLEKHAFSWFPLPSPIPISAMIFDWFRHRFGLHCGTLLGEFPCFSR